MKNTRRQSRPPSGSSTEMEMSYRIKLKHKAASMKSFLLSQTNRFIYISPTCYLFYALLSSKLDMGCVATRPQQA
jgi:hypothetical protein